VGFAGRCVNRAVYIRNGNVPACKLVDDNKSRAYDNCIRAHRLCARLIDPDSDRRLEHCRELGKWVIDGRSVQHQCLHISGRCCNSVRLSVHESVAFVNAEQTQFSAQASDDTTCSESRRMGSSIVVSNVPGILYNRTFGLHLFAVKH
jgi:hypothetical protein